MASPSLLPVSPAHGSFAAAATRSTARAHPLTMMAKLENAETKNAETKKQLVETGKHYKQSVQEGQEYKSSEKVKFTHFV